MSLRSTAQLAQDFPVSSTPLLLSSIKNFDFLFRDGSIMEDYAEVNQVSVELLTAVNALAENYAAPTAAFTGTAGTTARAYAVVPSYPLPYPTGGAYNAAGKYLNFLTGKPPFGYPQASASSVQADGVHRMYGNPSPVANVANTAATLDVADYVAITVPAIQYIPGTLFDVVAQVAGAFYVVALGVAGGATVRDSGPSVAGGYTAATSYYGASYVPRALAEVGYDANYPAGAAAGQGTVVYGPLTRLR